ncbi:MAG TPA: hypothetical protein EYH03_05565 [Chromatiales bacterium]|nr:hypothetical protein [Chromatiales bacterium]
MNRTILFLFLIVLAGALFYLYRGAGLQSEKGATLTPKEYIELVEKKKAARLKAQKQTPPEPRPSQK